MHLFSIDLKIAIVKVSNSFVGKEDNGVKNDAFCLPFFKK